MAPPMPAVKNAARIDEKEAHSAVHRRRDEAAAGLIHGGSQRPQAEDVQDRGNADGERRDDERGRLSHLRERQGLTRHGMGMNRW